MSLTAHTLLNYSHNLSSPVTHFREWLTLQKRAHRFYHDVQRWYTVHSERGRDEEAEALAERADRSFFGRYSVRSDGKPTRPQAENYSEKTGFPKLRDPFERYFAQYLIDDKIEWGELNPAWRLVDDASSRGMSEQQVRELFIINEQDLYKMSECESDERFQEKFLQYYAAGRAKGLYAVGNATIKAAEAGDVKAMQLYLEGVSEWFKDSPTGRGAAAAIGKAAKRFVMEVFDEANEP